MCACVLVCVCASACAPLTDDDLALDLLQDEAGLVGQLGGVGPQAAQQPVLPQLVVLQAQREELPQDVVHRVVALQTAHVVEQHLRASQLG